MSTMPAGREIAFLINDVGRLLRTLADHEVREFGMTRAQWAVLSRIRHQEGLIQSELAELLDLQPITLTRLIDRLAENGLIERRADLTDRRAKRLFVTEAANGLMARLDALGESLMARVLDGIPAANAGALSKDLAAMRDNLRLALAARGPAQAAPARNAISIRKASVVRRQSHG